MKRVNVKSVVMLVVFLLMAGKVLSQSSVDYKAKIEAINKDMAKYMLEGNTEKSLSLYTEDAISMPSGEPLSEGLPAIRQASADMAAKGMKINSFVPTTLKVLVGGNLITEVGTYTISMTMQGSDKPMDDHGKYLTIWEKQKDGSLKIKVETWNSDVDPMKMMTTADQSKMEKKN